MVVNRSVLVAALPAIALALAGCARKAALPPRAPAPVQASATQPRSRVVLVAGGAETRAPDAGPTPTTSLIEPFAVAIDPAHPTDIYVAEHGGNRLSRLDGRGGAIAIAGTGTRGYGGDGGPAAAALLAGPHHIAFPPGGGPLFIADTFNARVRTYDPATGTITTFAGNGEKGFDGDGGPASRARVAGAFCLAFNPTGARMYIMDLPNKRVRVVDRASGVISTFAGNGDDAMPEDGAVARLSPLRDPRAVAADSRGNVYILSRNGHTLHVVDAAGKIRRVAGTGVAGFSGDGGDARAATMRGPKHIGIDHENDVLITDTENHVIRKYIAATGRIVRVAGTGTAGAAGVGGPPEAVELRRPHGAFVDTAGAIYIADSENHRVLRIERAE